MDYPIVDYAKWFAIGAHGQQKRKYTGEPYWVHLERVALIVASYAPDIKALIVCWLHDVVEDTPITIFDIQEHFSRDIAKEVSDLTEPSKEAGNREVRKTLYHQQLAFASPLVHTVKCADILDNYSSIEKYDPDFAIVFRKEVQRLLPLLDKGNKKLYNIVNELINKE